MKRTTIFLDEADERELEHLARGRGAPKATLVREAIGEYLARRRGEVEAKPLAFVAIGRSGRSDVGERHEELLFQAEAERSAPPPPAASPRSPRRPRRPKTRRSPRRS